MNTELLIRNLNAKAAYWQKDGREISTAVYVALIEVIEAIEACGPHIHKASGVRGDDTCARCGEDLRDEIHIRIAANSKPSLP